MPFDIRSLLIAVALATAFCAGARYLLWRMHPTLPGLGRWALAGGASAVALFLILSYGFTHWPPALSLAQFFVFAGLILAWDGFRHFITLPPLSLRVLMLLTVIVVIWIVTAHVQDSVQLRALGNAILVSCLSALIARDLLKAAKPIPIAMRITGWLYAINALVFLLRATTTDLGAPPAGPLNPDGVAAFILLWWLCMTIAVTLGMVLMTTEHLQANLDHQANHDPLTGALNRRAFAIIAEKTLAQSRRYGKPLSILMMDLDHFKQINDRLGHNTGDTLLCRFVSISNQVLRDEDVFCRFGGEEFVALLPNTNADQALMAAGRLRTAFAIEAEAAHIAGDTQSIAITVSIGIAERMQEEDIENLLRRADAALYLAKDRGRNCCVLADEINNQKIQSNMAEVALETNK